MTRPLAIPTYTTGTVAVGADGTVAGTGTNFVSPDGSANWTIAVGDIFYCNGYFAPVSGVSTATALSLAGWQGGAAAAGAAYTIFRYSGLPNSAVLGLVQNLLSIGSTSNPFPALSALVGSGKINFSTDTSGNIILQVRSAASGQTDSNYVTAVSINPATGLVTLPDGATVSGTLTGAAAEFTSVGIGTAPDSSNPLSVIADNILFNEVPTASGGTGDMRVKLNKASSANTASVLYQDAFSGRAEIGLVGDDNFHFKVSPDGNTWYNALTLNTSNGRASLVPSVSYAFANKARNPDHAVAQLGTSGSVAAGASAYTLDGYLVSPTGAAAAWSQIYSINLAGNALRISCASGLTALTIAQRLESVVAAQLLQPNLAAQPVAVTLAIYNGTANALTPQLATDVPTARDNFGAIAADLSATNMQTIAAGTIGFVSYVYLPTGALSLGQQTRFLFGNQLNASSGYIDIKLLDIRVAPGIALGLNASPPPPEVRAPSEELAFCQRYYQTANGILYAATANNGNYGGAVQTIELPVVMRTTPVISGSVTSSNNWIGTGLILQVNASWIQVWASSTQTSAGAWAQYAVTLSAVL